MARILNPLFDADKEPSSKEKDVVLSIERRFNNIFQPIQATRRKSSDFLAYATTPFIDAFILEPAFAINACIELANAIASCVRAIFYWTLSQSRTDELIDEQTDNLMGESIYFLENAILSVAAQLLNTVFSTISLFTRPVASLAYALFGDCCDEDPKQADYQQRQEQDFRDQQRAYQDRAEDFQYSTSSYTPSYHH
jgi:hypothetical protein